MLKLAAHGVFIAGIVFLLSRFSVMSAEFWLLAAVNMAVWIILRLLAIMGELVYQIRNDSARLLASIERSMYYANSLSAEIRDLLDHKKNERGS
jgi:hypothetical protein